MRYISRREWSRWRWRTRFSNGGRLSRLHRWRRRWRPGGRVIHLSDVRNNSWLEGGCSGMIKLVIRGPLVVSSPQSEVCSAESL